jgi:hypothetical protein
MPVRLGYLPDRLLELLDDMGAHVCDAVQHAAGRKA